MSKYVRRFVPFLSCDICGIENWLCDMAKKGLFYKESGSLFAKFEVGEPKARHYKIEYENVTGCHIPLEKQTMYEEFGWTVLDGIKSDLVVVYTDDESNVDDEEITIDKISALEKLQKKHRNLGSLFIVLWFLSINPVPLIRLIFGSEKLSISDILLIGTGKYIFAAVIGVLLLLEGIFRLVHSNRMLKYIEWLKGTGEAPQAKSNAVISALMSELSLPLALIWLVLLLFSTPIFLTSNGNPVYEIGEYDFPLINEINEEEWQRILNIHSKEHSEPILNLYKDRDLLANDMYEVWQDDMSSYNGGSLDYHVSYYDLKKEKHAIKLTDEMAVIYSDIVDSAGTMHKEKESEKEGCQVKYYNYYSNNEIEWQGLLILYNNELVEVSYNGASDLSEYVDLYISYLKK